MENSNNINRGNIASLLLGITAIITLVISFIIGNLEVFIVSVICSILAIIFGAIGIKKKEGKALGIIGLTIGCIALIIEIIIFLFFIISMIIIMGELGGIIYFIQGMKAFTSVP